MLRRTQLCHRGRKIYRPWDGHSVYPITPQFTGLVPIATITYDTFSAGRAMPPHQLRALPTASTTLPMLYERNEQLALIDNALVLQREENKINQALTQLRFAHAQAEYFIDRHVFNTENRPTLYNMWNHDRGLRAQQDVLSTLQSHHLVPMFSMLHVDFEKGNTTLRETEDLYEDLMDCSVGHLRLVQRELANGMVRTYALAGEFEKGLQVIDEMKGKNIRRTFVTYAPLFRLARQRDDAEMQEAIVRHMMKTEDGLVNKWMFIDLPRVAYAAGVFIRFNWVALSTAMIVISTILVFAMLRYYGWV